MYAYVGCRTTRERNARGEGIEVCRVEPDGGGWSHVQRVSGLVNPSFLAFDRTGAVLYSVHGDLSEVSAFAVDRASGRLAFLNRQSTQGRNPVHLSVDPSNQVLVVANYATGSVVLLPIGRDGSLGPVADIADLPGQPGPHRVEQVNSHPHHVPFDREGRFILVPDKGLDRIFSFEVDAARARLVPREPHGVAAREGAGPRHIDFHPTLPFAYVANELDSTIATYLYERGALRPLQIVSSLPSTFTGNSRAAGIAVSRCGNFVYASNRGHDSIAIHAVDPETGLLSAVDWQPTEGTMPRFLTLDPSGRLLHVANETSDTVRAFRVDPASGRLTPTGLVVTTGSPVCVVFSPA